MIIRREILNMSVKNWDRLNEIFGEDNKSFEITPNEFLHIIGLPGVSKSIPNINEQEFFKQIYTIVCKEMINENKRDEKMIDDEIKPSPDPIIFDKSMARRCLSYFQGCKAFDENSFEVDKQCMSMSFGCMTIKCGFYEKGSKPVQINTSPNIISVGTKTKELKNNMTKKLTEAQKAEKKANKTKVTELVVEENTELVVEETQTEQTNESVIEEPKTEDVQTEEAPVKEAKPKKEKAPKTEKTPRGEGAVAKIEAMILDIVGKAGNMTVKAVNEACPSEFNAATWQVRIYHLRKANKLSYNKDTKEVSVV